MCGRLPRVDVSISFQVIPTSKDRKPMNIATRLSFLLVEQRLYQALTNDHGPYSSFFFVKVNMRLCIHVVVLICSISLRNIASLFCLIRLFVKAGLFSLVSVVFELFYCRVDKEEYELRSVCTKCDFNPIYCRTIFYVIFL